MGLSASQARLLTITSRKSDCEFQSMRYSHEKLALSRSMTDISNEYQNSLEATKLVYDFYGDGDESTPVSYGLLMSPSEMNGYMPMLTTTSEGRVVLNSAYAAAARAAGIPQEGLGCLPSSTMRNKFLEGLNSAGLISDTMKETCLAVEYSQDIGMGTTELVAEQEETLNLKELLNYISNTSNGINLTDLTSAGYKIYNPEGSTDVSNLSIMDLWNGDYVAYICNECYNDHDGNLSSLYKIQTLSGWKGWNEIISTFEDALDTGDLMVQSALKTAREEIEKMVTGYTNTSGLTEQKVDEQAWDKTELAKQGTTYAKQINGFGGWEEYGSISNCGTGDGHAMLTKAQVEGKLKIGASKYIGYYGIRNNTQFGTYYVNKGQDTSGSGVAIDISNIVKAYLTIFYNNVNALNTRYSVDSSSVTVSKMINYHDTGSIEDTVIKTSGSRTVGESNFVTSESSFNVIVDTSAVGANGSAQGVNTDGLLYSGYYDAMFNQIASRGWVENDNVNDKEYLQQMYKNGMMFLTTCSDDGYYHEGNYATNTYIKEVTDEDAIAKAEAKYNVEKQKLNHKEEIIDLKMKNLDTEISSLTTEYDTVKSLIQKNIEKGFKRYDA